MSIQGDTLGQTQAAGQIMSLGHLGTMNLHPLSLLQPVDANCTQKD